MNLLDWWSETRWAMQAQSPSVRALRTATLEPRILLNAAPVDAAALAGAETEQVAVIEDPAAFVAEMTQSQTGNAEQRRELILLDRRVPEAEALLSLLEETYADREVVWIDGDDDLSEITDAVRNASAEGAFDAIHLLSHGDTTGFALGSERVDADTIDSLADEFRDWQDLLTDDGDFLLYGCRVAETSVGQNLVSELAELTGADVAASDDLTGHASLGGDWILEVEVGSVETTELSAVDWTHVLATGTTVTFEQGVNGYNGIEDSYLDEDKPDSDESDHHNIHAQTEAGRDEHGYLKFDDLFGSAGYQVPTGATITNATLTLTVQDATPGTVSFHQLLGGINDTDTWNSTTNGIQRDDVEAVSTAAFTVDATATGEVNISDAGLVSVLQNWLDGTSTNHGFAIFNDSDDQVHFETVEETLASVRPKLSITYTVPETVTVTNTTDVANGDTSNITNLIASDGGDGISLREALVAAANTAGHDTINFDIETGQQTITLTSALNSVSDVTIDATTQPGYVDQPLIMLTPDGSYNGDGLTLQDDVTLRGLSITNMTGHGVVIQGTDNTLHGNWIGRQTDGSARGNGGAGIFISGGDNANNVIGGVGAGQGNVVVHNGAGGIVVNSGTDNFIRGNVIESNSGDQNVVLGGTTSSSDYEDGDTGANALLNQPEIYAVVPNGTDYEVTVYVQTEPNTLVTIDLLAASTANTRETIQTVAAHDVTTNDDGFATHTFTVAAASLPAGTTAFSGQILNTDGSSYLAKSVGIPSAGVGATTTYAIHDGTTNNPDFRGERRTSSRAIAVANDGRQFIVWTEDDGAGSAVWGRLVSADGTTATAATKISESAGTHHDASVAVDAAGRFVVVWAEQNDNDGKYRLINADGSLNGSERTFSLAGLGSQRELDVVKLPTGEFLITYSSSSIIGTHQYVARYDADGNLESGFGAEILTEGSGNTPREGTIAVNKDGIATIVWEEDDGLHIRQYDALNHDALGNDTLLGNGDDVAITALPDGRFFLAIADGTSGTDEIFGQFLNSDATVDGARFRIDEGVGSGPAGLTTPTVSSDVYGRIAIGYQRANGADAFYKIIDSTGATVVAQSDMPLDTRNDQQAPSVAFAPGTETLWLMYSGRHQPAGADEGIYKRAIYVAAPGTNNAPIVDTGGPYSIQQGAPITLDASGSTDPDGDTLTFAWDLDNDGNFAEPAEPTDATALVSWGTLTSFGINNPGEYTIGLRVSDGHGAVIDTTTIQVTVNGDPVADAGGPYNVFTGTGITLDASGSTDPNADTLSYRWDLDNDGNFNESGEPTGETPTVSWATLNSFGISTPGTYTIGVEADDGNGGIHTDTATLTVSNTIAVHDDASTNPDFRGDFRTSSRAIAVANDGKHYVVWTQEDGANTSIYGRLFNADGSPATGVTKISQAVAAHGDASVDVDDAGRYIVAWTNQTTDNGHFRYINADGTFYNIAQLIDLGFYYGEREFDVVKRPTGEVIFTWNAGLLGQEDQHIARYDANGVWQSGSGAHALSAGFGDDPREGSLAVADNGIATVAWIEPGGVHVRQYNSTNHSLVGSDTVIGSGTDVAVTALADGRYFLAITDAGHVYGQFLNSNGSVDGARFQIDEGTGGASGARVPTVSAASTGRIAIGYESASGLRSFYKVIDAAGNTVIGETEVPEDTTGDQQATGVAFTADGHTLWIVYQGDNNTAGEAGIWKTSVAVNSAPVVNSGGPYTINEGDSLALDASGTTDGDGDTLTYEWDLDDDGQYDDATGVAPTIDWAALSALGINDSGTTNIGVRVNDGFGGVSTQAVTLTVNDTPPTLTVTGTGSVTAGSAYTLNLSATDPGDDTITGWRIDWGDGTVQTIAGNPSSVNHTYANYGLTYNILVSATDEGGTWHTADLYVTGRNTDQVHRYAPITGDQSLAIGVGTIDAPHSVIYGADGNLYVSSSSENSIHRFNPNTGAHLGIFVAANSGGLSAPNDMAFGRDGNLYVVDSNNDQILRYNGTTGGFIDVFATTGSATSEGAASLLLLDSGDWLVSHETDDKILRVDGSNGSVLGDFVVAGSGGLNRPRGMTLGGDGNVYVVSSGNHSVLRFDATNGNFVDVFVANGTGGLGNPSDLAFGPDGNLYVASQFSDQVLRFSGVDGSFIDEFADSGIDGPRGMAFRPAHQVSVSGTDVGAITDSSAVANSVSENATVGTVVGVTASATDPDGADTVTYSLEDDAGGRFAIDANTGVVTVAGGIDFESNTNHQIVVRATSSDTSTSTANFTIDVTNVNEAPSITGPASINVSDDATPGTSLATFPTTDPDTGGGSPSWTVIGAGPFTMGGNSLILNGALDANVTPSYSLTIRVTDAGGLTADHAISVNVNDANQSPTLTGPAAATIADNAAIGTVVGSYSATDPNAGDTLSYSLTDTTAFAINASTGELTVAETLNADAQATHTFTVSVSDGQGGIDSQSVTITLTDTDFVTRDIYQVTKNATFETDSVYDWWNTDWSTRQRIRINNLGIASQSQVPIPLILNASNFDYGSAKADGSDLRIVSPNHQLLPHEIESWNPGGESIVWVKIGGLTTTGLDYFDVYYGNATATDVSSAADVFSNGYEAVYHLDETGNLFDNSAGSFDLTNNGSTAAAGQLGGGRSFDGANDYASVDGVTLLRNTPEATISAWVQADDLAGAQILGVSVGDAVGDQSRAALDIRSNQAAVYARADSTRHNANGGSPTVGTWHHLVGVIDYSNDRIDVYVDGALVASESVSFDANTTRDEDAGRFIIGAEEGGTSDFFDGIIDEVRIANVARDADWVALQYAAQSNTLLDYGTPVTNGRVSANDSQAGAVEVVTDVTHGSLTLNADGSFVYTPDTDYTGFDFFEYRYDNAGDVSETVRVDLRVREGNAAPTFNAPSTTIDTLPTVPVVFGPSGTQPLSITDDAPVAHELTLRIQTTGGTITLGDTSALATNTGTSTVGDPFFLRGTLASLNSALDGLQFSSGSSGTSETITLLVNDRGHGEGLGPVLQTTQTITVNVTTPGAVTTTISAPTTVDEGTAVTFQATGTTGGVGPYTYDWDTNNDGTFNRLDATSTLNIAGTTNTGPATRTVRVRVTDSLGNEFITSHTVTVNNVAPTVVDDAFAVVEDGTLTINTATLLANDSDPIDALSFVSLASPTAGNGTITDNGDGTWTFDTNGDFNSLAAGASRDVVLSYTVSDGDAVATGNVTIAVNGQNDAPALGGATTSVAAFAADNTLVVDLADSDVDGDALTFAIVSGNTGGAFEVRPGGQIFVADSNALDPVAVSSWTLTVSASDGMATTNATVEISLNNQRPIAVNDLVTLNEDGSVTIDVLANDSDPENGPLSTALRTGPSHGTVVRNPDGSFHYTPDANYHGSDSFTYDLSDGVLTATATVTITVNSVNDLPVITSRALSVAENSPVGTSLGFIAASDLEESTLNYAIVGGTGSGNFAINASTGEVTVANSAGLDFETTPSQTLQITVTDANSGQATETFTVQLQDGNDRPVADRDRSFEVDPGTTLEVSAANGLLRGASDPEGDPLQVILQNGPTYGTLTLNADGSFRYADGDGTADQFTVVISDGINNSEPMTVRISTIVAAPVGNGNSASSASQNSNSNSAPSSDASTSTDTSNSSTMDSADASSESSTAYETESSTETETTTTSESEAAVESQSAEQTAAAVEDASEASAAADNSAESADLELLASPSQGEESTTPSDQSNAQEAAGPAGESSSLIDGWGERGNLDTGNFASASQSRISGSWTSWFTSSDAPIDLTDPSESWRLHLPSSQVMHSLDVVDNDIASQRVFGSSVGTAAIATSSLTAVGYVVMAIRNGVLVTGLLAQMPAWRIIDPLVILDTLNEGDGESLESMIENHSRD